MTLELIDSAHNEDGTHERSIPLQGKITETKKKDNEKERKVGRKEIRRLEMKTIEKGDDCECQECVTTISLVSYKES